jgi:hypothetical protein
MDKNSNMMKKVINYLGLRKVAINLQLDKLPPDVDQYVAEVGAELEEELRQIDQALLVLSNFSYWVAFDWNKPETRPTKYGKYFVRRKDGKIHWETWNGSGWAYNGNVITHWMEVKPPCS